LRVRFMCPGNHWIAIPELEQPARQRGAAMEPLPSARTG
jgi:hypothetical protein